ncbi:MAG: hypothetical protein DSM106950_03110 [Stigonema ocellatum SAG 48.90 = DSM 106950]|nr:hypothetical protein [Stigonema ocellatum SAG 48.90 = DSM 106950]
MKKIIPASLVVLATTSAFLFNNQPVQAHGRFYHYPFYENHYPFYDQYPARYCYPVAGWLIKEDPAYHPQAYADGYRQGRKSAENGESYKPRTAGGEFARGFEDGYYVREFTGQKHIVPDRYRPYTTSNCGWY